VVKLGLVYSSEKALGKKPSSLPLQGKLKAWVVGNKEMHIFGP
jgi:hypothetical protein